jgi:hypothetical protein
LAKLAYVHLVAFLLVLAAFVLNLIYWIASLKVFSGKIGKSSVQEKTSAFCDN